MPNNASHTWKAILRSCDFIRQNSIWQVGSGTKINIWNDKWIKKNCFVPSPSHENHESPSRKVSDLMYPNERRWNDSIIYSTFDSFTIMAILAIDINRGADEEDKLI